MFTLELSGKAADVLLATMDMNTVVTGLVPAGRSRSCFPKKETTKQSTCITESLISQSSFVSGIHKGKSRTFDAEINVLELEVPLSRRPYGKRHLVSNLFCSSTPTQS
jgi:hypothetical protein